MVMAGQPQGNVIPRSLGWGLVTSFFFFVKAKLASSKSLGLCGGVRAITGRAGGASWPRPRGRKSEAAQAAPCGEQSGSGVVPPLPYPAPTTLL